MDDTTKQLIYETALQVKSEGEGYTNKLLKTGDEKFAFLMQDHPYHEYYASLLSGNEEITSNNDIDIPKDPSPFTFINNDPAGIIPSEDLNIIKKTAEYYVISSINGNEDDFLIKFKAELEDDKQFEFLKDEHSLNPVFKDFISQYKKVLSNDTPSKGQEEYLRQCFARATYSEYKKQFQKENKETQELYKIRFAAINWLKFHSVPKIELLFKVEGSNEEKSGSNATYKEPLDFSKITKKQISNTEITNYLNEYFEGKKTSNDKGSKDSTPTGQAPPKAKKRKGKILIKGECATRINKKRK